MDFGLNEGQQMLKTSAREFLERECPNLYVRDMEKSSKGYTEEIWSKLVELGWLGLVIPEKQGGLEMNFLELALILEEMGRVNFPVPYFSTVLLGGMTILEADNKQHNDKFLPMIAEGKTMFAMALTEPTATWAPSGIDTIATPKGNDQYILNGTKLFVSDADTADYFIVAARTSKLKNPEKGITLFIIPSNSKGITETSLKTVASDHQSELVFENVLVPAYTILGKKDEGWAIIRKVLQYAAVGKCAEMIGGAQKVLDMTLDYVKQRKQFGNPIGSFQAIQHHCANMATDVETSKYITYQAAWKLGTGSEASIEAATAKAWVSEAYKRICALAHQCHGAIGFTKEHDLQLYTRRAKAAELAFGNADFHLEIVAQSIGI
jgi:alkylation response protein AidB-like acyl-CoA dehydrogenase